MKDSRDIRLKLQFWHPVSQAETLVERWLQVTWRSFSYYHILIRYLLSRTFSTLYFFLRYNLSYSFISGFEARKLAQFDLSFILLSGCELSIWFCLRKGFLPWRLDEICVLARLHQLLHQPLHLRREVQGVQTRVQGQSPGADLSHSGPPPLRGSALDLHQHQHQFQGEVENKYFLRKYKIFSIDTHTMKCRCN